MFPLSGSFGALAWRSWLYIVIHAFWPVALLGFIVWLAPPSRRPFKI